MTDILQADPVARSAASDAERAARQAAVTVRELSGIGEQAAVVRLLAQIWGRSLDNPPLPPELLRAFGKAGNYISGAYSGDELVGATVGFHSMPDRHALHSHIAGVAASHLGRSIGYAMKLHQRAWALAHGVDVIEWTFDPLVARNAYFNIAKLRAMPAEYLPDFYGPISDAINGGDDTDRLLVRWMLRDPQVVAAAAGRGPIVDPRGPGMTTVAVPRDVERLRADDHAEAHRWRAEVRTRLGALLAAGGTVVGFDRDAGYIVRIEGHRRAESERKAEK
ncbi:GNAT family N-acetyltransferase [Microbacterium sp.]|uniref:GNAT family N-acetyltransferase n=1 Tax=Microbacterium sp. TaxID=51671 RepID=UPI0037C5980E